VITAVVRCQGQITTWSRSPDVSRLGIPTPRAPAHPPEGQGPTAPERRGAGRHSLPGQGMGGKGQQRFQTRIRTQEASRSNRCKTLDADHRDAFLNPPYPCQRGRSGRIPGASKRTPCCDPLVSQCGVGIPSDLGPIWGMPCGERSIADGNRRRGLSALRHRSAGVMPPGTTPNSGSL
jgi:hypothetical protein